MPDLTTNHAADVTTGFPRHDRRPAWLPAWLPGALHAALRAMTGLLFVQHGLQKLFGLLVNPERGWGGPPDAFSRMWLAGVLELFGGALVAAGLFTRPVDFLLAGQMAVAYFQSHAPRSFFPVLNGGEHTVLFCFVFLYLFATGAGPYSLDALLARRGGGAR